VVDREPDVNSPAPPVAAALGPARYHQLFEQSPGAKYICSRDGALLEVNAAFCALTGWARDELIGQSLSSFSLDPGLPSTELEPFLAGQVGTYTGSRRYRRGDGSVLLARVTLGAVRSESGEAEYIFGELEDAAAEHLARRELDRQRHRLQLAIEASGIAVWELEVPSGRITVQEQTPWARAAGAGTPRPGSEASTAFMGTSTAGAADRPPAPREQNMTYGDFVRSFHPDDRALLPTIKLLRSGSAPDLDLELRMGGPFGPVRWVHLKGRAVRQEDGRVVRVAGSRVDVTEPRAQRGELAAQRDRLEMALETAAMMAWELSLGPRPRFSAVHAEVMGLAPGESPADGGLAAAPVFGDRVHPADRQAVLRALEVSAGSPDREIDVEYRWVDEAGAVRWAHTRARPELGTDGQPLRYRGTTADVTATREEVAARLRAESILSRTVEASRDAFIATDHRGLVTDWNPAAEALFGWFRDEVLGQSLAGRIGGDDQSVLRDLFSPPGAGGGDGAGLDGGLGHGGLRREVEVVTRDGRRFPVEVSAVRVEDGGVPFYQLFVRDVSERKAYESQLVRNALYDPLTGLPNRALLVDRLNGAVRRLSRVNGLVAVLFIDVDRFAHLNETLGHGGGDQFLVELAARLRSVLRPADTVARLGADEFVVLCEALDGEREAMALALRVEGIFSAPFVLGPPPGMEVYASASLGIALGGDGVTQAETMVRDAATAMKRAKEHGGGHAEVFDAEIRRRSVAHFETESELRRALEHGELSVYYQPVVDLTGRLEKLEALVRWPQRSGRVALPNEFVPIAEETGLIVALGDTVLEMACGQVGQWRRQHPSLAGLEVAVNISSNQLRARDAVERMASIVEQAGLPADALVLEITESVFMDEHTGAAQKLAALRSLGVRLAVDDFGTGYSSLLYLRRYPLDMLKIDRSFVAGLVDNPEDATIVDAVVRLGHSFGLQTVAEGVETAEQLRLLRSLGCDMGQGHFWGRPLPPEMLIGLMLDGGLAPYGERPGAAHPPPLAGPRSG
jgi:diguanylate cyclase (GGDEF)-like protein/PAS domain S-box-containing protein